jgi:xanthine dehydrogenase accessory factor
MSAQATSSMYDLLTEAIRAGTAVATATIIRGEPAGAKLLVLPDETVGTLGNPIVDDQVISEARRLLSLERSETQSMTGPQGELEVFFESFPPPPTLIIFGAVHVAQALTTFAKLLGYRVVIVDVRAKLASAERFPDADEIVLEWPDVALENCKVEPNTAIAILSHDPKFDEPALLGSLATPARYIGAVGSRKTNAERRVRLQEAGVDDVSLKRVHGPIGLDIGASTPEEMAISILAEIIASEHGRAGGPLTTASGKIRARV